MTTPSIIGVTIRIRRADGRPHGGTAMFDDGVYVEWVWPANFKLALLRFRRNARAATVGACWIKSPRYERALIAALRPKG